MTETKIYCDHCGKELNEMHDYVDVEIDTAIGFIRTDLCHDCVYELDQMVKKFCEQRGQVNEI